jgi:hypothetical protein
VIDYTEIWVQSYINLIATQLQKWLIKVKSERAKWKEESEASSA